ncbi:FG-GAP repeat domain-containing protein [Pseudoduganella buxea]|uniref:PEP-CTERM sorting domain-containing protein n=1 Tax=Pseudoduganella buxea TaxID=1949069 RepID=A0A6I3SRY4_9BURK|nr:VCBS repeat-containing protein [Pseudoduganella buxea]MTV51122.1 hypothetical protein [Pseudoduganella buxea]GGB95862.1 hypothetical protein GCM10011572_17300 [Pseudoduganella buxea]
MKTLLWRSLLLIVTFLCVHAQASPILYLQPERQTAQPGAPVVMGLWIRDLDFPADTVGAFDVELNYDDDFLRLASVRFGPALGAPSERIEQITVGVPGDDPASVRMVVVSLLEASPDDCYFCQPGPYLVDLQSDMFQLATLTFDWIHAGPGTTTVDFSYALLADGYGEILPVAALIPAQVGIPEPGTAMLVGMGLLAMLCGRRPGAGTPVRRRLPALWAVVLLTVAGTAGAQPVRPGTHQPFLLVATNTPTLDAYFIRGDGAYDRVAVGGTPNGARLAEMAIADFDGDGTLDFVAASNENPARLYLFRRTGAHSFTQPILIGSLEYDEKAAYQIRRRRPELAPDYGMGLMAGDVDADDDIDIVETVNDNLGSATPGIGHGNVWLNDGSGTFTRKAGAFEFPSFGYALGISTTLAHLDGDRYPDLLVSEGDGERTSDLYVLRGSASGTFGAPVRLLGLPHAATFLSVGNIDDGGADILEGMDDDGDPGQIYGLLRSRDGSLDPTPVDIVDTSQVESGNDMPGSGRFQLYDVNGDGVLDIVAAPALAGPVADTLARARLEYYQGLGDGRFGPAQVIAPEILVNTGFTAPVQPLDPPWPRFMLAAKGQPTLDAYFTLDGTRLAAPVAVGESPAGAVLAETAVADFDGDGQLDFVAAANEPNGEVYLYRRTGPLTFAEPVRIGALADDPKVNYQFARGRPDLAPDYGLGLIPVDLDDDGDVDLLEGVNRDFGENLYWIAGGNAWLNDGAGNFTVTQDTFDFSSLSTGWTLAMSATLGDLNGDGKPDMLVSEQSSGGDVRSRVYALMGGGDGTFAAPSLVFTTPHPATFISMGDVNNNGTTDALVGMDDDGDPGQVYVYIGFGDGTFYEEAQAAFDTAPATEGGSDEAGGGKFQLVDLTGDGVLDVVASPALEGPVDDVLPPAWLRVYRGRGNGRYDLLTQAPGTMLVNTGFSAPYARPAPGFLRFDLNGDGNTDLRDMAYLTGPRQPAIRPYDPLEMNHDGFIDVADARLLVLRCTAPRCIRLPRD